MTRSFNVGKDALCRIHDAVYTLGSALDIGHFQEAESRREHTAVSVQSTVNFSCHFVQCQGLTPITSPHASGSPL